MVTIVRGQYIIAGSIVLGSAFIAIGAYFGLAQRAEAAPTETAAPSSKDPIEASATESADAKASPAATPAPSSKALSPKQHRESVKQAERALAKAKAGFVKRCWAPAVAKQATPASSKYRLMLSFDAKGNEVGRGISELANQDSRPDVAACLRMLPLALSIPAAGAPTTVELELQLP
jgi:hypothetical protein